MDRDPQNDRFPLVKGLYATLLLSVAAGLFHAWVAQAGVRAPRPQVARTASPTPDYSQMSDQEKARYRNQLSNQARENQMEASQARDKALVERVGRAVKIPPVKVPAPLPRVATPQSQQARETQLARAREAERAANGKEKDKARLAGTDPSRTPPQTQAAGPTSFVEVTAYGWSQYGRTETLAGGAPIPLIQVNRNLVGNLVPGSAPLNPFVAASVAGSGAWQPTSGQTPPDICDQGALHECCALVGSGITLSPTSTPQCCNPADIPPGYRAHSRCVDDSGTGGGGSGFNCDPHKFRQECCDFVSGYDSGRRGSGSAPDICCHADSPPLPQPYCP